MIGRTTRATTHIVRATGATELFSSTLHYVVHDLSYCSLAIFMGIVYMGFTKLVSGPVGLRKKKKKKRPPGLGASQLGIKAYVYEYLGLDGHKSRTCGRA